MKHKRVWTDEQRRAAAERMNHAREVRMANLERARTGAAVLDKPIDAQVEPTERVRAPEVQAVLDTMTPERRAKLENIQRSVWANGDRAAQRAMEEHDKQKAAPSVADAERVSVRDVMLRVSTDGTIVSLLGPCVCGAAKREWHSICLQQKS